MDSRRAIALLPDVRLAERKITSRTLRARRWVSARTWAEETAPTKLEARRVEETWASTGYGEVDLPLAD